MTGLDNEAVELARATQQLRLTQSRRTHPWLLISLVVLCFNFWGAAPHGPLLIWFGLFLVAALLRSHICHHAIHGLGTATVEQLRINQFRLVATGGLTAAVFGSGFWWIGVGGSQSVVFSLLLLSCVFAIGTMVNVSVDLPHFTTALLANVVQAILYFSGLGGEPLPVVAISIGFVTLLMLGFARENSRQFRLTVRTRLENAALVERIAEEKAAVEIALLAARAASENAERALAAERVSNAKVERALAEKNRVILAASHDLRNALSALTLQLANLGFQVEGAAARRTLENANTATEGLRSLMEALLDLSVLDAGGIKLNHRSFRIDLLLQRMVREFAAKAALKELSLTAASPALTVRSDEVQIARVLHNLVTNALNYTVKGQVTLSAAMQGGQVVVTVEDTGPGIAAEDQERIFDDFVQLSNPARNREQGLGLGLSIVRRLDRALGLKLALESKKGVGSRFSFSLPATENATPAEASDPGSRVYDGDPSICRHVWIIEDDVQIRSGLRDFMVARGCFVTTASSHRELECSIGAGISNPDLALIDDMLGGDKSGLDIAIWLRDRVPGDRIKIMTGNVDPARLQRIRDEGFQLLLKPLSEASLQELLLRCQKGAPAVGLVALN